MTTTTRNNDMSEFLIKSTSVPNFDFDIQDHYHFKSAEMMWLVHETIEECYLYIKFTQPVHRNSFRPNKAMVTALKAMQFLVCTEQKTGTQAKKLLYTLITQDNWKPRECSQEFASKFIDQYEHDNQIAGDWDNTDIDRKLIKENTVTQDFISALNTGQVQTLMEFIKLKTDTNERTLAEFARYDHQLKKIEDYYWQTQIKTVKQKSLMEVLLKYVSEYEDELPTYEEAIGTLLKAKREEKNEFDGVCNPYIEVLWHVAQNQIRGDNETKKRVVWLYGAANSGKTRLLRVLRSVFSAHPYKPGKGGYDLLTTRDAVFAPMVTWDEISPDKDFGQKEWENMKEFFSGEGLVVNAKYQQQVLVFKKSWIVIASNMLPDIIDLEKYLPGGSMSEEGYPQKVEEYLHEQQANLGAFRTRVKKFKFDISHKEEREKPVPFDPHSVAVILREFVKSVDNKMTLEETLRMNPITTGSTVEPVDSFRHSERSAVLASPPFETLEAYQKAIGEHNDLVSKVQQQEKTIEYMKEQIKQQQENHDQAIHELKQQHQIEMNDMESKIAQVKEEADQKIAALRARSKEQMIEQVEVSQIVVRNVEQSASQGSDIVDIKAALEDHSIILSQNSLQLTQKRTYIKALGEENNGKKQKYNKPKKREKGIGQQTLSFGQQPAGQQMKKRAAGTD